MAGLSEDFVAALVAARCPRPCKGPPTLSQKRPRPDGSVEITGEAPRPLCGPCPQRSNPQAPPHHIEVRFELESGGDIGEVVDTESACVQGAGIAIIRVLYDDSRSAHPGR
jgi:hypothetical protein